MNMNFDYPFKSRNDFLKEVVSSLVHRRRELKLTQDELNHKLGMSDRHLSKWECGMRTPTAFHLYCWADSLEAKLTIVTKNNNSQTLANAIELVSNDNEMFPLYEIKKKIYTNSPMEMEK